MPKKGHLDKDFNDLTLTSLKLKIVFKLYYHQSPSHSLLAHCYILKWNCAAYNNRLVIPIERKNVFNFISSCVRRRTSKSKCEVFEVINVWIDGVTTTYTTSRGDAVQLAQCEVMCYIQLRRNRSIQVSAKQIAFVFEIISHHYAYQQEMYHSESNFLITSDHFLCYSY